MPKPVDTCVYNNEPVNKLKFHDALMVGVTRFVREKGGKGSAADALGFTAPALDKVYSGGTMTLQRAWEATSQSPDFMNEIAGLYGLRVVPADAVCTSDRLHAGDIVAALHKIIEAEADGKKDHAELLGMEPEMLVLKRACDEVLGRIAEIRGVSPLRGVA